jgi:hypothetical protein
MQAMTLIAQNDFFTGLLAMGFFFWILAILATIFWLWMLIDALVNERRTEEKLLWFLVIVLLNVIGALIYFFVRKANRGRLTI